MNEAQMHYAKMPDYNIYAYHSITYNLFCKIADAKNRPVVTVVCGWRYEFTIRGHRVCRGSGDETAYPLTVVLVIRLNTFVIILRRIH